VRVLEIPFVVFSLDSVCGKEVSHSGWYEISEGGCIFV
jgi:hypothetical protein